MIEIQHRPADSQVLLTALGLQILPAACVRPQRAGDSLLTYQRANGPSTLARFMITADAGERMARSDSIKEVPASQKPA